MHYDIMSSTFRTLALGLMLTTAGAAMAVAAPGVMRDGPGVAPRAFGGVAAPSVRLAAFIGGPFATPPSLTFRSKGVASVTHPEVGLWCIKPSFTSTVTNLIPVLTVEYSNSSGAFGEMAQYRSSGLGCAAGRIAVLTFEQDGTNKDFVVSDNVAFTIIVP